MTALYLPPGLPAPSPPVPQPNTYVAPSGPPPQLAPSPQPPPEPPQARDQDHPHHALLSEWRARHGSDWVRADALHPAVRRLIDPKNRAPAIRQRLRLLVNKPSNGFTLETKTVGNRARPVAFYRPVESKQAGLEG